jgi:hypothetical protein
MKNICKSGLVVFACIIALFLTGCSDATMASHNLSKAAEQFEIDRRIVFYNGITGEYMLSMEGRCSVEHTASRLGVTCKVGRDAYKKHYLGLSDNVTYFSEQLETANISVYHYRIIFKPQSIIPDIDFKGDIGG